MSNLQETALEKILSYKPVKYLVTFTLMIVVIMLIYSSCNHVYRCSHNLNSRFLWGFHECDECRILPTKVDTLYRDTCINKGVTNNQKIDSGGSGIQNNAPVYGNQAGRDYITNNYKNTGYQTKIFVPEDNQTIFPLPADAPTNADDYKVTINGVEYYIPDFGIESGRLILRVDFKIEKIDRIVVAWPK